MVRQVVSHSTDTRTDTQPQCFVFFEDKFFDQAESAHAFRGGGQVGQIKLSAEGSVGDFMLWRRCVTPFAVVQKRRFAATFCPLLEQLGDIVVELPSSLITISLTTFFPFSQQQIQERFDFDENELMLQTVTERDISATSVPVCVSALEVVLNGGLVTIFQFH